MKKSVAYMLIKETEKRLHEVHNPQVIETLNKDLAYYKQAYKAAGGKRSI